MPEPGQDRGHPLDEADGGRGVQFLSGVGLESVAIGWPFPLTYKRSLRLSVVVNENGVVQILANVVRGSSG